MPTHAELAKIHIAKRDLKLSDPLYRGFLNVLFGQGSARDLTHDQVEELLDHFKSLGWHSEFHSGGSKTPTIISSVRKPATMAQLGLIVYLWKHGIGIRHKSMDALEHFLNHQFHISHLKQTKAWQVPGIVGAIRKMAHL